MRRAEVFYELLVVPVGWEANDLFAPIFLRRLQQSGSQVNLSTR